MTENYRTCTIVIHTIFWKFSKLRLTSPSGPIRYSILSMLRQKVFVTKEFYNRTPVDWMLALSCYDCVITWEWIISHSELSVYSSKSMSEALFRKSRFTLYPSYVQLPNLNLHVWISNGKLVMSTCCHSDQEHKYVKRPSRIKRYFLKGDNIFYKYISICYR